MITPRIIPASALRPGLATIVVSLPGRRTIRSRVFRVELRRSGIVNVAFTSGDMIAVSERTMVGSIERAPRRRRPRPPHLSTAS